MLLVPSAAELIRRFDLQPHPEGGFFRESYRSSGTIPQSALPGNFSGDRHHATAIYFLLPKGSKSSLHRIQSDEIWHFYLGCPLSIIQISPTGTVDTIRLGPDILNGQTLQHVVPAGFWFGAFPDEDGDFSLVGCTVSPGFDFNDFELADAQDMLSRFPSARQAIERLTASA